MSNGFVVTFRARRRRTGRDWVTVCRGCGKLVDVVIAEIGHVVLPKGLRGWERLAGFDTLDEWLSEIRMLNGFLPDGGWLYLVVVLSA